MLSNLSLAAEPPAEGPPPAPQPSLAELLAHAQAEKWPARAIFGGIFVLSLIGAALVPPSYRATATLAVLPAPEFTVRPAAGSPPALASALATEEIMEAESQILESDTLHLAALQQAGAATIYPAIFSGPPGPFTRALKFTLHLILSPWRTPPADEEADRQQRALQTFAADLKVIPAKESNVISLSLVNRSSAAAAGALNALLAQYAKRRASLYQDPQLAIIRQQSTDAANRLAAAERALALFKTSHNISDDGQQRTLLLNRRNAAEQAAADAQASVRENQARLDALAGVLRTEPASIGLYNEQDADVRLQAVNAALADLRAKLAAAREKYLDGSHTVTSLEAQIASNEAEAKRLATGPALSVVRTGRNPSLDPLHLDRARASAELEAARARAAAETQQSAALTLALSQMDANVAALADLQRQRDTALEAYHTGTRILTDRHLSEAEDAERLANVRVIQAAVPPQRPRSTPLLVIAAGVVLGFIAACAWSVTTFITRPVLYTAGGVEAATGFPVLAVFEKAAMDDVFIDA